MSNVTSEQQETLQKIWNELHTQKGDTQGALNLAQEQLNHVPRESENKTDFYRQLAWMGVALAKSLAKRARTAEDIQYYAATSLDQALFSFPLSRTLDAVAKGNEWQSVYPKVSAQQEIARHLFQLVELLKMITQDPELDVLAVAFSQILYNPDLVDKKQQNRALLLQKLESGKEEEATLAYHQFVEEFGPGTEANQLEATILASGMYIGRMAEVRKFAKIGEPLQIIYQIVTAHPELLKFTMQNTPKHLFGRLSRILLERKIRGLMSGQKIDIYLENSIKELKSMRYFGTGNSVVADLRNGEEVVA